MEFPKRGLATVIPDDAEQKPFAAYFTPPKKKNYPENWLLLWQDESDIGVSMMEQAKANELTRTDYRVRDYLMGSLGLGNCVYVNQAELAKELRLHKVTVCESIKRLCEMQILIRGPKSGKSNTYMVNPAFCFRGSLANGVKERKEAIKDSKAKVIQFNGKTQPPISEQGSLLEG